MKSMSSKSGFLVAMFSLTIFSRAVGAQSVTQVTPADAELASRLCSDKEYRAEIEKGLAAYLQRGDGQPVSLSIECTDKENLRLRSMRYSAADMSGGAALRNFAIVGGGVVVGDRAAYLLYRSMTKPTLASWLSLEGRNVKFSRAFDANGFPIADEVPRIGTRVVSFAAPLDQASYYAAVYQTAERLFPEVTAAVPIARAPFLFQWELQQDIVPGYVKNPHEIPARALYVEEVVRRLGLHPPKESVSELSVSSRIYDTAAAVVKDNRRQIPWPKDFFVGTFVDHGSKPMSFSQPITDPSTIGRFRSGPSPEKILATMAEVMETGVQSGTLKPLTVPTPAEISSGTWRFRVGGLVFGAIVAYAVDRAFFQNKKPDVSQNATAEALLEAAAYIENTNHASEPPDALMALVGLVKSHEVKDSKSKDPLKIEILLLKEKS